MSLSENDLQYIGQYVRAELPGWLRELGPWAFGSQLMERMVRVEEELKSQRELLLAHMQASDRRFEAIDHRFDDVNKRFEDVNKRFDDNNRRHTATQWFVGAGFLVTTTLISLYQFLG